MAKFKCQLNFTVNRVLDASVRFLYDESSQLQDFTEFTDSMGLPVAWISFDLLPPKSDSRAVNNCSEVEQPRPSCAAEDEVSRSNSPFRPWLPSIQPGNRSVDTMTRDGRVLTSPLTNPSVATGRLWPILDLKATTDVHLVGPNQTPFTISEDQRGRLEKSLDKFRDVIPEFCLPSRHTITRYLISFFEGFHTHLPFIHVPTLQIDACYPEFVLAIATCGAQYRFEHRNAKMLFYAAKSVVLERIRRQEKESTEVNASMRRPVTPDEVDRSYGVETSHYIRASTQARLAHPDTFGQMQVIRCIFLLMGYGTWEQTDLLQEAIGFQSILVRCLRAVGLNDDDEPSSSTLDWHEWAQLESDRRTKLVAYCFLNVHTIAYNTPPIMLSSEIFMHLPCSTNEWNAEDNARWQLARQGSGHPQLKFQEALTILLKNGNSAALLQPTPPPLGNYIILHGLFQRIYFVRELSLPLVDRAATLPSNELDKLE